MQNLFTNIDVGLGTRVFTSGGDDNWGPHSGYLTTFHNIQADIRYSLPNSMDFGANITFIGLPVDDISDPSNLGWHVELLSKPFPRNLYTDFARTRASRNA